MFFRRSGGLALGCASVALFVPLIGAASRPIPEVVNVKAYARPDARQFELLVRVPLAAVKDVQFPARGDAGYLDLAAVRSMLSGAARYFIASRFVVYDNGQVLAPPAVAAARISNSEDQSFDSYKDAVSHFGSPELADTAELFWDHVWLDIRFQYPLGSGPHAIAIDPQLAALGVRVSTSLSAVDDAGGVRTFSFDGDPGLVYLNAHALDAAGQFLRRGAGFVTRAAAFLLFLFCLALPFRHYRDLAPAVVLFGAAVFVAILLSGLHLIPDAVWFRPLIAVLETVAILLAAFANIAGRVTPRRRALFALCAGIVFGFSGSFALGDTLQFGGSHPAVSSAAFYAGMVAAAVAGIALLIPVLTFLFSLARVEHLERIIVSALAADTAWGWLEDRWAQLAKIPLAVVFENTGLALALRALAVLVLVVGLLWFVNEWLKAYRGADDDVLAQPKRKAAV